MDLSFNFDPEVLIGADTLSMAGTVCKRHGQRIMVAADHSLDSAVVNRLKDILEDSGLNVIVFDGIEDSQNHKCGVEVAENIVELSQASHCDAIVGIGGHKTQIIARMAAIMAPMRITAFELLDGRIFHDKYLPLILIPTKGLDVFSFTEYFLAPDPRSRLIKTIPSPANLCSAVIIDSALHAFSANESGAAFLFSGFASAVEAYCSSKANFMSDALLERAISFYAKIIRGGGAANMNADTYVQADFLTAFGTSASSPGAGAALAAAINAKFSIPKEQCYASLLPAIADKLIAARPEKMVRIASFLGAGKAASVAEGAAASAAVIRRCMEQTGLKESLKEYNISLDRVTASLNAARSLDFIVHSPWIVSEEDVFAIIKQII